MTQPKAIKRQKSLEDRASELAKDFTALLCDYRSELIAAQEAETTARVSLDSSPVCIQPGETAITEEVVAARGFKWNAQQAAHYLRHGRMTFYIRVRSRFTWWMSFDSMYGGSVHSYREMRSMEEVECLLSLFGFDRDNPDPRNGTAAATPHAGDRDE